MNLNWHSANREDVVAALRGGDRLAMDGSGAPGRAAFDFVIYAVNDAGDIDDRHVSMLLLGNERKEFFSWVATYAEDVFPVSMCARVLHRGDWDSLHLDGLRGLPGHKGSRIWASVVLGELLGQSAGDIDVASVPIGRAPACFSYAIARTELLYPGNSYAAAEAAERLAIIGRDARLGRRALGVEALSPLWSVPRQLAHLSRSHLAYMDTVLKIVDAIDADAGRLLRDVESGIAEYERELISERTSAGMRAARAQGKRLGRPKVLTERQIARAERLAYVDHRSMTEIAARLKVGRTTIWRALSNS